MYSLPLRIPVIFYIFKLNIYSGNHINIFMGKGMKGGKNGRNDRNGERKEGKEHFFIGLHKMLEI